MLCECVYGQVHAYGEKKVEGGGRDGDEQSNFSVDVLYYIRMFSMNILQQVKCGIAYTIILTCYLMLCSMWCEGINVMCDIYNYNNYNYNSHITSYYVECKVLFMVLRNVYIIESVDSISRDERDVPLTQYITNA